MPRTDRAAALNVAWASLWWLLDPEHDRWGKVREVLADPTSRLVIDQGSRDNTGRRQAGTHSDPTASSAMSVLDVGLDQRKHRRELQRFESDIAETAHWIVGAIRDETHAAPLTLADAVASIDWSLTIPHNAAAWRAPTDEYRREMDHACDHLCRESKLLVGKVRHLLAGAVKERPKVDQPKPKECRAHARWAKEERKLNPDRTMTRVLAVRNGLCEQCLSFRTEHRCDPTPAILRAWDWGRKRLTPSMIAEAKAEHAGRRKGRKVG